MQGARWLHNGPESWRRLQRSHKTGSGRWQAPSVGARAAGAHGAAATMQPTTKAVLHLCEWCWVAGAVCLCPGAATDCAVVFRVVVATTLWSLTPALELLASSSAPPCCCAVVADLLPWCHMSCK